MAKELNVLITLGLVLLSCQSPTAIAEEALAEKDPAALQASSKKPVYDDRVAALWGEVPAFEGSDELVLTRLCTASHIGNNKWLTAHHCVSSDVAMNGYLEQADGEVAGIASISLLSGEDDVAIIHAGDGVNAASFQLPSSPLDVGQQATLLGFGDANDFASAADIRITGFRDEVNFGVSTYANLYEARSLAESRSCYGDSGGPIYIDDTLYAVHTAGEFNPGCADGINSLMYYTDLVPRLDWITAERDNEKVLTVDEINRAQVGKGLAGLPEEDPAPPVDNEPAGFLQMLSAFLSKLLPWL